MEYLKTIKGYMKQKVLQLGISNIPEHEESEAWEVGLSIYRPSASL